MKEYKREFPEFALCGLNCGLCPRHQTEGTSRCPGCGGENFHLQHPACSVITCNKKHDNVEFCFQCSHYPCERYEKLGDADSFISYRNVRSDFEKAQRGGIGPYLSELNEKKAILEYLLVHYNDGRSKNFYCLAVNLLDLGSLQEIWHKITYDIHGKDVPEKERIYVIRALFERKAEALGIELKLRK